MSKSGIMERQVAFTCWGIMQGRRLGMKVEFGKRLLHEINEYLTGYRRFPKARVWPPLPPSSENVITPNPLTNTSASTSTTNLPLHAVSVTDEDLISVMPDPTLQEHLLEIYFTHVHSAFPILHKEAFMKKFQE